MTHGSIFSGIGGFDLAAKWMGWENVFQCEIDSFCLSKLIKNFPNVKRYTDIKYFDGTPYKGRVNVLTGGYPCQPFSVAGSQKAENDDRHLWPFMFERIKEIRPDWVICENVFGHIKLGLDNVLDDLESIGYSTLPLVVPALSVGANHNRERVFIVANAAGDGFDESTFPGSHGKTNEWATQRKDKDWNLERCCGLWSNLEREGRAFGGWGTEPPAIRVDDGLPERMDRIKALGNAIVPQVAYNIFKAIQHTENQLST